MNSHRFLQIAILGFLGSLLGAIGGHYIQLLIPLVLEDFLPVALEFKVSWLALTEGVLIGFIITMLFAWLPLVSIRFIPPLAVLRNNVESIAGKGQAKVKVIFLIILFSWIFALIQTGDVKIGSYFYLSFLLSIGLFGLVGFIIVTAIRRFFPYKAHFIFRQSLANPIGAPQQGLLIGP